MASFAAIGVLAVLVRASLVAIKVVAGRYVLIVAAVAYVVETVLQGAFRSFDSGMLGWVAGGGHRGRADVPAADQAALPENPVPLQAWVRAAAARLCAAAAGIRPAAAGSGTSAPRSELRTGVLTSANSPVTRGRTG
jgi:hypothetical protein